MKFKRMKLSPLRGKPPSRIRHQGPSFSRVWKADPSAARVSEQVLRPYLIHCHLLLAKDYPVLATMPAEEAANLLLRLRKMSQIQINLTTTTDNQIKCEILGKIESLQTA